MMAMKLTKDMFDFEKYDYSFRRMSTGDEYLNMVTATWLRAGQFDYDLRITRVPKPPPRYILLNEGEKLQEGDECYVGGSPSRWAKNTFLGVESQAHEIWRRKVQE